MEVRNNQTCQWRSFWGNLGHQRWLIQWFLEAFNLFLTHSLTLLGFFGGVDEPPAPPPPVIEVIIVEIIKPSGASTAVSSIRVLWRWVLASRGCFYPRREFFNRFAYSRKLGSQFFTVLRHNFQPCTPLLFQIGNDRFDSLLIYLQIGRIFNLGELALLSCNMCVYSSISVSFPALFSSYPLILVSALSIPKNSRFSRSVFVLISLVIFWWPQKPEEAWDLPSPTRLVSLGLEPRDWDLTADEGVSIPSRLRASEVPSRVRIVLTAKNSPVDLVTLTNSPGEFSKCRYPLESLNRTYFNLLGYFNVETTLQDIYLSILFFKAPFT